MDLGPICHVSNKAMNFIKWLNGGKCYFSNQRFRMVVPYKGYGRPKRHCAMRCKKDIDSHNIF